MNMHATIAAVQLGGYVVAWAEDDIEAWISTRLA